MALREVRDPVGLQARKGHTILETDFKCLFWFGFAYVVNI